MKRLEFDVGREIARLEERAYGLEVADEVFDRLFGGGPEWVPEWDEEGEESEDE